MANVTQKAVSIVVLIALAVVAQIITGVLGQVSYVAGNTLLAAVNGNTAAQSYVWFTTAGQSPTTILNFMTIVFLVSALVILLSLFGMDKIFNLGREAKVGRSE